MPQTIKSLAETIGGKISGDDSTEIFRAASLEKASENEISFVEKPEFFEQAQNSNAACLIVPENFDAEISASAIRVKNPKLAFALVAEILYAPRKQSGIHPSAQIEKTAQIASDAFIGAFVSIGKNAKIGGGTQIFENVKIGDDAVIGENCFVYSGVVIYEKVSIGNNVILHTGAVIGAEGFGFVRGKDRYVKFPQIGTVTIEDDVEIGANSCVDRGSLGDTRIGKGTKIDNLVQIAHNVQIGERVVIAAQTGISGSTIIEDDCVIGGQVGMGDHARVLAGAIIGSQAGVLPGKIVRAGVWWGTPVQPLDEYKRQNAQLKSIGRLKEELKEMKRKIAEIEKNL